VWRLGQPPGWMPDHEHTTPLVKLMVSTIHSCSMLLFMSLTMKISKGGQLSVPAVVRHRWATDSVVLEDLGDALVIRPLAVDPVASSRGVVRLPAGLVISELRATVRAEDTVAEGRRGDR